MAFVAYAAVIGGILYASHARELEQRRLNVARMSRSVSPSYRHRHIELMRPLDEQHLWMETMHGGLAGVVICGSAAAVLSSVFGYIARRRGAYQARKMMALDAHPATANPL